jgi:hypothetical protein
VFGRLQVSQSNGTSGFAGLAFVAVIAWGIYSCTKEDDRWSAYVYPNRSDLTVHQFAGDHPTLETCRVASLGRLNVITDGNPSRRNVSMTLRHPGALI